jgi:hypothetical protein
MSDKEYLARKSATSTMPWLNRVPKELGIHHEEYVVPPEVFASIEEKKKKAAAKNATAAGESRKRKGQVGPKAVAKKLKTVGTFAAPVLSPTSSSAQASASAKEGSVEDTGVDYDAPNVEEAPTALVARGGSGAEACETFVVDPFLSVLGGESSPEG